MTEVRSIDDLWEMLERIEAKLDKIIVAENIEGKLIMMNVEYPALRYRDHEV